MRTISIINQKGGVGKTTTAISLAAGLSRKDRKVLVLDLDAQGNVGVALNSQSVKDMYSFLIDGTDYHECVHHLGRNLDIITSKENLTKAEIMMTGMKNRELLLRSRLKKIKGYDYILIDCSPSVGLLNQNAILASDEAIVPTSTDHLGLHSLGKIIDVIATINEVFGHNCTITKIVPTLYDRRLKTCKESFKKLMNEHYGIVSDPVHTCSKLKESPKKGRSIFSYAPGSTAAKDYGSLVWSVIRDEQLYSHEKRVVLAKA